jgi:hypothetical protein
MKYLQTLAEAVAQSQQEQLLNWGYDYFVIDGGWSVSQVIVNGTKVEAN